MQHEKYDIQTLLTSTFPSGDPIIEGLLYTGENSILLGAPKVAKTLFSLQLGLCAATGTTVAGRWEAPASVPVLYVGCEGTAEEFQTRVKRITTHIGAVPEPANFTTIIMPFLFLNTDEGFSFLNKQLEEHRPRLLILDPLYRFHKGTLVTDDFNLTTARVNALTQGYELACLVDHHTHREKHDQFGEAVNEGAKGYYGTIFIEAWANNLFFIKAGKTKEQLVSQLTVKNGFVRRENRWYGGDVKMMVEEREGSFGFVEGLEDRIVARLDKLVTEHMGIREIARLFSASPESTRQVINKLHTEGKVSLNPQGPGRPTVIGYPLRKPGLVGHHHGIDFTST